jgi:hypothetical protein
LQRDDLWSDLLMLARAQLEHVDLSCLAPIATLGEPEGFGRPLELAFTADGAAIIGAYAPRPEPGSPGGLVRFRVDARGVLLPEVVRASPGIVEVSGAEGALLTIETVQDEWTIRKLRPEAHSTSDEEAAGQEVARFSGQLVSGLVASPRGRLAFTVWRQRDGQKPWCTNTYVVGKQGPVEVRFTSGALLDNFPVEGHQVALAWSDDEQERLVIAANQKLCLIESAGTLLEAIAVASTEEKFASAVRVFSSGAVTVMGTARISFVAQSVVWSSSSDSVVILDSQGCLRTIAVSTTGELGPVSYPIRCASKHLRSLARFAKRFLAAVDEDGALLLLDASLAPFAVLDRATVLSTSPSAARILVRASGGKIHALDLAAHLPGISATAERSQQFLALNRIAECEISDAGPLSKFELLRDLPEVDVSGLRDLVVVGSDTVTLSWEGWRLSRFGAQVMAITEDLFRAVKDGLDQRPPRLRVAVSDLVATHGLVPEQTRLLRVVAAAAGLRGEAELALPGDQDSLHAIYAARNAADFAAALSRHSKQELDEASVADPKSLAATHARVQPANLRAFFAGVILAEQDLKLGQAAARERTDGSSPLELRARVLSALGELVGSALTGSISFSAIGLAFDLLRVLIEALFPARRPLQQAWAGLGISLRLSVEGPEVVAQSKVHTEIGSSLQKLGLPSFHAEIVAEKLAQMTKSTSEDERKQLKGQIEAAFVNAAEQQPLASHQEIGMAPSTRSKPARRPKQRSRSNTVNDAPMPLPSHFPLPILWGLMLLLGGLTVAFASGALRFGLAAAPTFVVYVIAGLLVGAVCFGLLKSGGSFEHSAHGAKLRLSGAIVAAALVPSMGGLYERYLRTPDTFDCRVRFIPPTSKSEKVRGTVRLFLGNDARQVALSDDSGVLFQGIATQWRARQATLVLDSPDYEIAPKESEIRLDEQVAIHVDPRAAATPPAIPAVEKPMPPSSANSLAGIVTDDAGKPIALVDVLVSETDDRARTTSSGRFLLPNVAVSKATLRLSRNGFQAREELVNVPTSGLAFTLERVAPPRPPNRRPSDAASVRQSSGAHGININGDNNTIQIPPVPTGSAAE